jgi:putative flippase GtrA
VALGPARRRDASTRRRPSSGMHSRDRVEADGGHGTRNRVNSVRRYLRSPPSGLAGQITRFALTGGVVSAVYMGMTTVLSEIAGVPFQVALAVGFIAGLSTHFTLQRVFVWIHDSGFALDLRGQVARYLALSGALYGSTAAVSSTVPSLLHVRVLTVYLAWTIIASTVNSFILRRRIFHPHRDTSRVSEARG